MMFKVRKDLCLACGRCAITCFRGAISLESGQAEIDQSRCNRCGVCVDACAQGAIFASIPVSKEMLIETISDLKSRTQQVLLKIEALKS
jgi:ferredoxin